MSRRYYSVILCFFFLLTIDAVAQEQRTSTLQKPVFPMLEYVNISAELGLESDMLRGFGARVDDARRSADPAALATQALVLSFAEEIAAKTATTVTALGILEEAVRIAEEQQSRTAASVISAAARRIPGSQGIMTRMTDSMALFMDMRGDGNFIGYIRVTNDCDRALDIYVDGAYKGFLFSGENMTYSTGNGTTTVRATDAFGNSASEIFNLQPDQTMTWTITP
ncbi:MAG: hypothetical protein M5R41_08160 [Bacteroidia bacterium]|nr:hypothetical protein [Bacteroidia bacterium]